jgi:hypothetical protein
VNTTANLRVPSSVWQLFHISEINRLPEMTRYRGFSYCGVGVTQVTQRTVRVHEHKIFSLNMRFFLAIFTMLNLDIISEVSR